MNDENAVYDEPSQIGTYSSDLSSCQQGIWVASELNPGALYTISFALQLTGCVDEDRLARSWKRVLSYNDSLRTSVAVEGETPRQFVGVALVPELEWRAAPLDGRSVIDSTRAALDEQAHDPFLLEKSQSLVRISGIRYSSEVRVVLFTFHHLCFDGGSIDSLLSQLNDFYSDESASSDQTIQFSDFAAWEESRRDSSAWRDQLDYWRAIHLESQPSSNLGPEGKNSSPSTTGGMVEHALSSADSQGLSALSITSHTSKPAIALAAWAALFWSLSASSDLVLGAPIARRDRPLLRKVIGPVFNTVLLRLKTAPGVTFSSLVESAHESLIGALANQEVPWELVSRELGLTGTGQLSGAFEMMFNFENSVDVLAPLGTASADLIFSRDQEAKTPLALYLQDGARGTLVRLAFQSDFYPERQAQEILDQYVSVLSQGLEEPETLLSAFDLRTRGGQALLDGTTGEPRIPHEIQPLVRIIEERVIEEPTAIAVKYGDREWSYGTLIDDVRSLADQLSKITEVDGRVVSVAATPGYGLVCTVLAIWANGGIYFPVDRRLPFGRQTVLFESVTRALHVDVVVDDSAVDLGRRSDVPFVAVSAIDCRILDASPVVDEGVHSGVNTGAGICYLFMTSGTTGAPKPVWGTTKSLGQYVRWFNEEFKITSEDSVGQLTNLSFDPSLREIFPILTVGGMLCIPDDSWDMSGPTISKWMESAAVSVVMPVPTIATGWLKDNSTNGLNASALRLTLFAGEPLTSGLVDDWRKRFPSCREVVNLYGPSETTLSATFYRVPHPAPEGVQLIGKPRAFTGVEIRTTHNELAGLGQIGDIFIASQLTSSVMDGVTGEPIPGFRAIAGAPAYVGYSPGDRGRIRTDGQLEILGRSDDQIKIGGVRTTPAEVEAVICRHPLVEQCVVTATKAVNSLALVAYITTANSAEETGATVAQLRRWLHRQLPLQLIPSSITVLMQFPTTANGKVDRSALPQPATENSALDQSPSTVNEKVVADVIEGVLGIRNLRANADIFMAGAHSLLVAQIIARIANCSGVRLAYKTVFDTPTVQGIAAEIDRVSALQVTAPSDQQPRLSLSVDEMTEAELDTLLVTLQKVKNN